MDDPTRQVLEATHATNRMLGQILQALSVIGVFTIASGVLLGLITGLMLIGTFSK